MIKKTAAEEIQLELRERNVAHLPVVLHTATVKSYETQAVQGKSLDVSYYQTDNYPASPFHKMISRVIKPLK